jgi:hypothetical protein
VTFALLSEAKLISPTSVMLSLLGLLLLVAVVLLSRSNASEVPQSALTGVVYPPNEWFNTFPDPGRKARSQGGTRVPNRHLRGASSRARQV